MITWGGSVYESLVIDVPYFRCLLVAYLWVGILLAPLVHLKSTGNLFNSRLDAVGSLNRMENGYI